MNAKQIFLLLLLITLLTTACSKQEIALPPQKQELAEKQITAAPAKYVLYPDDRPSIPDGKVIFAKMQCAQCHGMDGSTQTSGVVLSDKLWLGKRKPVDQYILLAYGNKQKHHESLQDKLSEREIWNLVFYTRSLAVPALKQADLDAIEPVFGSNCAVCHGTKGDGDGPLARNLEPMPANFQNFQRFFDRDDDELFDHIANGIKWEGMPNFLGKVDRKKNVKFDQPYIRKLVQYVRHFHVGNTATLAITDKLIDKTTKRSLAQRAAANP